MLVYYLFTAVFLLNMSGCERRAVVAIVLQTVHVVFPSSLLLSRCPWLSEYFSSVIPIYNAVIFLFTLANFCMATFMDPGVFPRGERL